MKLYSTSLFNFLISLIIVLAIAKAFIITAFGASQGYTLEGKASTYESPQDLTGKLTFEILEAAVRTHGLASVDEVLGWIAQHYPAHLQNFTLMRVSGSAQGASEQFPRAIVYGPDASFIMTFNGHPSQKGYDRLEMIQFRDATSSFEFREIVFPKHQKANAIPSKAMISGANPASCIQCHQTNLRPLWDPYEIWRGAYGERDDVIKDFSHIEDLSATDGRRRFSAEYAEFQKFLKLKPNHDRYRWLQSRSTSPVAPYSTVDRSPDYNSRPNLRLTKLLTHLRAKQISKAMQKANSCDRMTQSLVLAYTIRCDYGHNARPALDELEDQMSQVESKFADVGYSTSETKLFRLLQMRGWDSTDWSLKQFPDSWGYFTGSYLLRDHVAQLLFSQIAKRLPAIQDYPGYLNTYRFIPFYKNIFANDIDGVDEYGNRDDYRMPDHVRNGDHAGETDRVCVALIEDAKKHFLNLKADDHCFSPFANLPADSTSPDGETLPEVVRMCASCHTEGRGAPHIDFYDKPAVLKNADLKQAMLERIKIKGQSGMMPPTRSLTERERQTLIQYFELEP